MQVGDWDYPNTFFVAFGFGHLVTLDMIALKEFHHIFQSDIKGRLLDFSKLRSLGSLQL